MQREKKPLYLIQQAGMLLQMPRSHKRNLGTAFDTIASHSFHVTIIAYVLAKLEWLSDEQAYKCMAMATFHDIAESRTGDHDFVAKNYNDCDEEKAIKDQCAWLPFEDNLQGLLSEYEMRISVESKVVKDADSLAQTFHERVLMRQGNKMAEQWFESDYINRIPFLTTNSAKNIAYQLKNSNPNERWWDEFIDSNFDQTNLTWRK